MGGKAMSNELSIAREQTMLEIIHDGNSDLPINPFETEIRLATFMVADTLYGEQLRGLAIKLREGIEVKLFRELDSVDDEYAIRLEAFGKRIGYIPSSISEIPANLMDAGKFLYAKINKCSIGYAGADILVDLFMRG